VTASGVNLLSAPVSYNVVCQIAARALKFLLSLMAKGRFIARIALMAKERR